MHVATRVILILAGIALTIAFCAGMAGGGTSWNEALLAIAPLTIVVVLSWIGVQSALPSGMPAGSPPALKWKKSAGVTWGILGILYFLGLGTITAVYAKSQAESSRSSASFLRQQARDARSRDYMTSYDSYDPYGYGYRSPSYSPSYSYSASSYERDADYAETKARRHEEGVSIGWGFAGLALFPLVGLIVALGKKSVSFAEIQQWRYANGQGGWGPQPWGGYPGQYPQHGWHGAPGYAPQGYGPQPQGYGPPQQWQGAPQQGWSNAPPAPTSSVPPGPTSSMPPVPGAAVGSPEEQPAAPPPNA